MKYSLICTEGLFCGGLIDRVFMNRNHSGYFAICTSFDSGNHGFPIDGPDNPKIVTFELGAVAYNAIQMWSGAYDEFYIFKNLPDCELNVCALCNWGIDFPDYDSLADLEPNNCRMKEYLNKYSPDFIIGCNHKFGYIFYLDDPKTICIKSAQQGDAPDAFGAGYL